MVTESRTLRVLIVEDHVDGGDLLAGLVRLWGHEAHLTRDGLSGLRAAQTIRPARFFWTPACRKWTGGRRQSGCAGSMAKKPLLIAVTGYGKPEDRQRLPEAGIDHHLVKPVDPDQIHELLSRLA
jgi:CheY-like chemotaxis protein